MKKRLYLLLIPALLFSISSCSNTGGSGDIDGFDQNTDDPNDNKDNEDNDDNNDEVTNSNGVVRICYHDEAGKESSKNVYVWVNGISGTEFEWDGKLEDFGVYKDIDLDTPIYSKKLTDSFFFIIKNPNTWSGQSSDIKISLSDYLKNGDVDTLDDGRKRINVYVNKEASEYITYYKKSELLGSTFSSVKLEEDWSTVSVTCSGECLEYSLYALDAKFARKNKALKDADLSEYFLFKEQPISTSFTIDLTNLSFPSGEKLEVVPTLTYVLEGSFADSEGSKKYKTVSIENLYDTQKFIDEYTYSGDDLGVKCDGKTTVFKVWSPISIHAQVLFYYTGTPLEFATSEEKGSDDIVMKKDMTYIGNGVYTLTVESDYSSFYYQYRLFYNGSYVDTSDPYATSCGVNGERSAIVNFSKTNPDGWDNISYTKFNNPNELIPYEVHIRDLTSSSTWISNKGNERGTYNAFCEENTGYNGVTTGFDHIKELGVNAVQILPFFDSDNDERTYTEKGETYSPSYNWGYNPKNYNCLEGAYSSNPFKADVRIKEFKNLVKTYADNDIRIIMDVVYNHVSGVSTNAFSKVMPKYYFRYDDEGGLIDDTGCSNTVNSSRFMVNRFIVDSVCFWAKEYNIKGFRFDLMGVLETSTLREVKDALYDIDPEIVVYGEGWTGGGSHSSSPADTYNIYSKLQDNGKGSVGSFNDCYRDGMKGNTTYADVTPSGGFMNAYNPSDDEIWNSSTGMIGQNRNRSQAGLTTPANMTVNYLSCHDNYTLYDQMNYLLNGVKNCDKENKNAKEATLASQVNSLMSEGIAFINGGEEIFRTKIIRSDDESFDEFVESYKKVSNETSSWIEGDGIKIDDDTWLVRNSYKYGDSVNGFDYSRKVDNYEYFVKFKEAIKLRKESYETYLGLSQEGIESNVTCLGGSAVGGAFKDSNNNKRIVITSGRKKGALNNINEEFQGEYKVIYCSSSRLSVGSSYTVYSSTGIDNTFETLVLEKAN